MHTALHTEPGTVIGLQVHGGWRCQRQAASEAEDRSSRSLKTWLAYAGLQSAEADFRSA